MPPPRTRRVNYQPNMWPEKLNNNVIGITKISIECKYIDELNMSINGMLKCVRARNTDILMDNKETYSIVQNHQKTNSTSTLFNCQSPLIFMTIKTNDNYI